MEREQETIDTVTTVELAAANAVPLATVSTTRAPDARHAAILNISGLR
jgi:hypothetical protein